MKSKKLPVTLATLAMVVALAAPVLALAEGAYGSAALVPEKTYTAEEMLNLAIEDEYMARAEYTALQSAFPAEKRLANLIKAEDNHILILSALMEAYGYAVPEDLSAGRVSVPATLKEAYEAGVQAETKNMAMYEAFLGQQGLPDSLRGTFTLLRNASGNHLKAFARGLDGDGLNRGGREQNWLNNRRGRMGRNGGTCPLCGADLGAQTGN